jgi:apolipoprotein N-acyltransferase
MDHFTASDRVMVAQVPIGGARTIYSYIGDAFAWLGVLVLVALAGYAIAGPAASP